MQCSKACCLDPCPTPRPPWMVMWTSQLDNRAMGDGDLVWWITLFFPITWISASAFLTWKRHGTRMHYGKIISGRSQCEALGYVLLGKLCSSVLAVIWTLLRHAPRCCRPTTARPGNGIPWWLWPLAGGQCALKQNKNDVLSWPPNSLTTHSIC